MKMLHRKSSKLGRRKSTSSTHSKHEIIDSNVARQHAHAAATLAFARAQERHNADMDHRGGGFSRSSTTASYHGQQQSCQASEGAPNVVRRQRSVRFVGPNAVQRRQFVSAKAVNCHAMPRTSPASLRPMALTTSDPVPAAYRPPSRSSSIGKASTGTGTAENFVTALAAYNEYYTQEDDVASTPSSYRRIRRSKSMFSPINAPNILYTNGTPERPLSRYRSSDQSITTSRTPQCDPPRGALRTINSMNFLGIGNDHLTLGVRERNDEAVQLARDRFFHQTTQQRLRERPSFLFKGRAQRQEKTFRQTVRSSSTNSYGMPIASVNQDQQSKEPGLKEKARRVSRNLKYKLRRAFRRNKEDSVEIPNQQVDAPQTHVRRYPGDSRDMDGNFDVPYPNPTTLQRVASRPPSIRPANSSQQLRSYAGSVKSVKSIKSVQSDHSDDRSRVTSWQSTGVSTLASLGARHQSERDAQRLSIINENGTHFPSSSFSRQKLSNQFSAYPIINRPSNIVGHTPSQPSMPIDSARVYSALMKRLDDSSPKAKLEAARKQSQESLTYPKYIPSRTSSVHDSRGNETPATIRQVLESRHGSEGSIAIEHEHQWVKAGVVHCARAEDVFGHTGTHVHQWAPADPLREARMRDQDDVFSPQSVPNNEENLPYQKQNVPTGFQRGRSGSIATQDASIRTSYHTVPEDVGQTPQEIAVRNEPVVRGPMTLRETKSTFFGGTGLTITRTTSPFRRALAEANYNSALLNSGIPASLDDFPIPTPLQVRPNITNVEADKAYSESIYSRTTSGQGPGAPNDSALSLPLAEGEILIMPVQNISTGDVVILDRATYRSSMPVSKGHRATSSASSTEWKKWMSSEVAKLERAKESTNAGPFINYALPTMPRSFHPGHVRECAQINDDDTDIAQRKVSAVKQPVGIVQQTVITQNARQMSFQNPPLLKPILKNRSAVSLVEGVDSNNINSSSIPIPTPPPPPIPPRSPLRTMQSKSSLHSVNTVNTFNTARTPTSPNSAAKVTSVSGTKLLHKRNTSQCTLRSMKSLETPAKIVKRSILRPSNTTVTSTPGGALNAVTEKQFGSTSMRSRTSGAKWSANRENRSPLLKDDVYGIDGSGLMGPMMTGAQELNAQQMGSKRMVDLFLSGRRRQIAGASEESGSGVFI